MMQVSKYSRSCLGKFAIFGGDSFNRHEVILLQSWREPQKPPPPSLRLSPGVNRVKSRQNLHKCRMKINRPIT